MSNLIKICGGCTKEVYPMDEQINCDGKLYHRLCCKCRDCGKQLNVTDYWKSSDFLDEHFLLCRKDYDDRFFLIRSKLKKGWKKSEDGYKIELKVDTSAKGKFDKFGKPTESHSERQEVAENVFLISSWDATTKKYGFQVENNRDEALILTLDFTDSINVQMSDGNPLSTFIPAGVKSLSETLLMEKVKEDEDHEFALNFFVHTQKEMTVSKWDEHKPVVKSGSEQQAELILDERVEIATSVFLISKFTKNAPQQFTFQIENQRPNPVTIDMDLRGSFNLKCVDLNVGLENVFVAKGSGGVSEPFILNKEDEKKGYDINMNLTIRREDPNADPTNSQGNSSLAKSQVESGDDSADAMGKMSLKTRSTGDDGNGSGSNTPPKKNFVSPGLERVASVFSGNSGFVPNPSAPLSPAEECDVKFYGGHRLTVINKK